jgi:hypothetical protein
MGTTKPATVVKARLRNFGNGILEVSDEAVKFYVQTGRFKKHRETIRDIPTSEIETLERQENDVSITWKGNTDVFAVEQTSQVLHIQERILAVLKERQETNEDKVSEEQVEQKQSDQSSKLVHSTANAVEVVNSLFEVLRHLHGRIDWKIVELSSQRVDDAVAKLASENENLAFLDVKPIAAAIQQRFPKEIAYRTFDALKMLHERFNRVDSSHAEGAEQPHPKQHDARLTLQAFFVWNDMTLGAVVGDKDTEKESAEMLRIIEELVKQPSSQIDSDRVRAAFEKLSGEREKQKEGLEELKAMLELQLKDFMSLVERAQ